MFSTMIFHYSSKSLSQCITQNGVIEIKIWKNDMHNKSWRKRLVQHLPEDWWTSHHLPPVFQSIPFSAVEKKKNWIKSPTPNFLTRRWPFCFIGFRQSIILQSEVYDCNQRVLHMLHYIIHVLGHRKFSCPITTIRYK